MHFLCAKKKKIEQGVEKLFHILLLAMENKEVKSVVPKGGFHCRNQSLVTNMFVWVRGQDPVCQLMFKLVPRRSWGVQMGFKNFFFFACLKGSWTITEWCCIQAQAPSEGIPPSKGCQEGDIIVAIMQAVKPPSCYMAVYFYNRYCTVSLGHFHSKQVCLTFMLFLNFLNFVWFVSTNSFFKRGYC